MPSECLASLFRLAPAGVMRTQRCSAITFLALLAWPVCSAPQRAEPSAGSVATPHHAAPAVQFAMQPQQCVTTGEYCEKRLQLRWILSHPQPVCLEILDEQPEIVCWQQAQTQWQGDVRSQKNIVFRLWDARQQQVLASVTLQVLRSPRRHLRRSAAWSVF